MRTSEGWARRVRSVEDAPSAFRELLSGLGSLEHVVASPKDAAAWDGPGDRIFILGDRDLTVAVSTGGGPPVARRMILSELRRLEWGRILLNSWISLGDAESEIRLPHNAAVEPLFLPILDRARREMSGVAANARFGGNPALDELIRVNFKFHSYADVIVGADSRVRALAFSPEIRARLFGVTIGIKTPNQLMILTDHEWIFIAEEVAPARFLRSRSPYGAITAIHPRAWVADAVLERAEDPALLVLRLQFDKGPEATRTLAAVARDRAAEAVEAAGGRVRV